MNGLKGHSTLDEWWRLIAFIMATHCAHVLYTTFPLAACGYVWAFYELLLRNATAKDEAAPHIQPCILNDTQRQVQYSVHILHTAAMFVHAIRSERPN